MGRFNAICEVEEIWKGRKAFCGSGLYTVNSHHATVAQRPCSSPEEHPLKLALDGCRVGFQAMKNFSFSSTNPETALAPLQCTWP